MKVRYLLSFLVIAVATLLAAEPQGQSSGTLQGTITDPSGAVVPNATVQVANPATKYSQSTTTDASGQFALRNVPLGHYHLTASATGFANADTDVEVTSHLPVAVKLTLAVQSSSTEVTVTGAPEGLVETDTSSHTDVSEILMDRLPKSVNSGMSSVLSQTTPGIAQDSNGQFHPLGEHSDTTFAVDNQPISDQQSRTFSNQISTNTVQSVEAISGVAPAEYGDKASLVVVATTKSGLGTHGTHGGVEFGYGSFGTATGSVNVSSGTDQWGNFVAIDGINSGRFLDTPEFRPLHAHGNSENIFDRFDYQLAPKDVLHLNLTLARSWFQQPNTFQQQFSGQDQRQLTKTFNFAPGYSHQFNEFALLTANAWVRQDRVGYYPSNDPFADQPATLSEQRRLTNTGLKSDVSYTRGIHDFKVGVQWQHTFLSEQFATGLTDPAYNAVCLDPNGGAVSDPSILDPAACGGAGFTANPNFSAGLLPYDLTRGGSLFRFRGHADVKQESAYVQDTITWKRLTATAGLRGDVYNGLSSDYGVEPRLGISYMLPGTGTVLRASYGHFMLTPYNENLVLSSNTGTGGLTSDVSGTGHPLIPAKRNHFETGVQQGFGKYVVVDANYFWKFTNDDFDFDTLLNTTLAFPIQWQKSKIDGASIRVTMPDFHGFSAYSAMGHTRSRFFGPEVGGIFFNSEPSTGVFRIDHDQAFQQTTHLQYQFGKNLPWIGFTWTYESGMVAGNVPDFETALGLTGDEQAQMGLFCGSTFATVATPIRTCAGPIGATRVQIPAAGTENDDKNPPRIAPRHVLDATLGTDNLFRSDKRKVAVRFTVSNLTNKVGLYNFLSTFSGTHFLSPRTFSASVGYNF